MIITRCPYCEDGVMTPLCDGMGTHKAEKCESCEKVFWVEMTRMGGTTVSHEYFKEHMVPKEDWEKVDAIAANRQSRCDCLCHRDDGSEVTHMMPCCDETYKKHKQ